MSEKHASYTWEEGISARIFPESFAYSQEPYGGKAGKPCFEYTLPYGANLQNGGVNFRIFSRHATEMRILFYDTPDALQPSEVLPLYPETNRWGDVWCLFVPGCEAGTLYHLQADGPFLPEQGLRYNRTARLIDPYSKALAGEYQITPENVLVPPKCVVTDDRFEWFGDRHLNYALSDSIIYEMHVGGLTRAHSSACQFPGTYRGVIEKIPYLKSLGISAVELMPVQEFVECDLSALTERNKFVMEPPRQNYWGYDPVAFFAPHRGYAANRLPGAQVHEFKEMVRELHRAGIEVILDVVFNHTAEGNERGTTLSFKGLENSVYYILEPQNRQFYTNYSGCGNTVNGNHPIVRELIFDCLRYWVHNFHIDGFRFDLASILSRDQYGNMMTNPPIVEAIAEDPLLADTKIIAEAWDAAGAYQVGNFSGGRWAEWNGKYRDDVRRYWRGDSFMTNLLATRVAGSSDLYKPGGRSPYHSINFITSHDGFTLNDLVSYNQKHNEANGEENRDGDNNGFSSNYGMEGVTNDEAINACRLRQIKNMMATLLFSQGVPMLLMGDECRRTQQGNNNAYCQNTSISWFDWCLVEKNAELVRFVSTLTKFRRTEPTLRRQNFLTGEVTTPGMPFPDVSWYRFDGKPFNWSDASTSTLVCMLAADVCNQKRLGNHLLTVYHSEAKPIEFRFPPELRSLPWRLFVNTATPSPYDIFPDLDGPLADTSDVIIIPPQTFLCYLA